jgi:DNA-binding transcriptional MerR regulator
MATNGLTAKQEKGVAALLNAATIKGAAEEAGVSERTIHTWLNEPAFEAAYRTARRDAIKLATTRLQIVSSAAVGVLCQLTRPEHPPAVRLGAASKILDLALKSVELDDLQVRLEALERAYEQKLS